MFGNSCAPLILSNTRIYNYAQFTTEIELIKRKYSDYSCTMNFDRNKGVKAKIVESKESNIHFEDVIESYFENKVRDMMDGMHKDMKNKILQNAKKEIKSLEKKESRKNNLKKKININSINYLQNWVKEQEAFKFNNPFLKLGSKFLEQFQDEKGFDNEKRFLESCFIDYIKTFLRENGKLVKELSLDDIKEFVKLKYDKEEFHIQAFEGRYPFAELYVLFRSGMEREIKEFLAEGILKHLDVEFDSLFTQYFRSGKVKIDKLYKIKEEDKFKVFFYKLMSNCDKGEGDWILTTFEDFLWYQLKNMKNQDIIEVNRLFNNVENDGCRLIVALLTKSYSKCYDILTTGKFTIVEIFFFAQLLCKVKTDNNFILDVVFVVAKEFTSTERKIMIIDSIKDKVENYKESVAEYIVKYSIFDIIGLNNRMCLLDIEIGKRVANILKKKKDRRILIQLYYLLDDEELIIDLLNESMSELILSNNYKKYYELEEIVEYFSNRSKGRGKEILNILRGFIMFLINPTDELLRRTMLFDESKFIYLEDVKLVVEKVIIIACKLIKSKREKELSKNIIKLCTYLYKGKECAREISECLIELI
ncbi:Nucleoporin Nic96 [Spraguea lophii 42_110]|uniref:Nucleoporin Nic96 n=1 Tax=Spraguea lophii (strain 42_110) TaxID=1358809 RepID=S7XTB3_SPRLO|nr:Nucleoporin Nic96 [Spraguea lophii 42_110]